MEQAVYYDTSEIFVQFSLHYSQIINTLLSIYERYMTLLSTAATNIIESIQSNAKHIKDQITHLLFVLNWLRAYSKLSLLYAEDLTIFIRRRNRFYPKQHRTVGSVNNQDCDI